MSLLFPFRPSSLLLVLCVLVLALLPGTSVQAREDAANVIGKWRFASVLDSSEITSIDTAEARRLVGQVMTISKDKVQFGSRVCTDPDFETESVEPNLYLRSQANASASNLGLPNPVTVFGVSCTVVFIKSRNRLVVHWKGFFFDAVRVKG